MEIRDCLSNKFSQHGCWYFISLVFVILIGVVLRILFYSYNRPFWNDECALALNIENSWNYFKTLSYGQSAPQLFMYCTKFLTSIFGMSELVMRFIPLVSSIFSIPIFYILAVKVFNKKSLIIISVLMFSLCYPLCYYGQEFKPYSSDVLVFLTVLTSYFYLDKFETLKSKILLGLGYAVLIWFSYSTVFALFAIGVTLLIKEKKEIKSYFPIILPIFISVITFLLLDVLVHDRGFFYEYWKSYFFNSDYIHNIKLFLSNIQYFLSNVISCVFVILSLVIIWIKDYKKSQTHLILTPLIMALLLAIFKFYPFSTRLILFLAPIYIILALKWADYKNFKYFDIFVCLCCIFLVFPMSLNTINKVIFKNYGFGNENIVTPLKIAASKATPQDVIIISEGNSISYDYYKKYFTFNCPVMVEEDTNLSINEYISNLDKLEKNKTYYWISSHTHRFNKNEYFKKIYDWARYKPDFEVYSDKNYNSLIIFTLR